MSDVEKCPECGQFILSNADKENRKAIFRAQANKIDELSEFGRKQAERVKELEIAMRDIRRIAMESMENSEAMQTIYGYSVAAMRNVREEDHEGS